MSRASTGRWAGAGLAASLVVSGCSPYAPLRTEVRVRDPSRVSLRSLDDPGLGGGDPHAPGRPLIPEGGEPARGTVKEGRLVTGAGASAAYRVDALREPGGAIAFDVDMKAPLVGGERRVILAPNGTIGPLQRPASTVVSAGALSSPDLSFPVCGSLAGARYGYRFDLDPDCSRGLVSFGGLLSTPWANVVEVRESQLVEGRSVLVILAAVGSAVATIPGGLLVGFAPSASESPLGPDTLTALGGVMLGAAVALGIYAIVAGAAPDRVRVLALPGGGAAHER
jgi:hypothetical protein